MNDFFSKCDQIRSFLESFMESFIFCTVKVSIRTRKKSVFGHFSRSTELWLEHLELHDKLYSSIWTIYSNNWDLYVICLDLLFVSVSQRIWLIKFTRFINMIARKENSAHFLLITKIFITILWQKCSQDVPEHLRWRALQQQLKAFSRLTIVVKIFNLYVICGVLAKHLYEVLYAI